jgi:SAM-dependent methyltransferase
MHTNITLPKRRTLARWYRISKSPYTLLRTLQYEAIENLCLDGKVLDIGGGYNAEYHGLLNIYGNIETINISKKMLPTYILNIEKPLAFKDECFDHVLSLNTFEHIKNDELAISEAVRVLKKGGTFHFAVPFCYRVHGSPSDYHRHTSYWWSEFMASLEVQACTIEPLVWDPRSSADALLAKKDVWRSVLMFLAFFDPGFWARRLKDYFPMLRNKAWRPGAAKITAHEHEQIMYGRSADFALGYYISGTR